jgi:hypothetical protein
MLLKSITRIKAKIQIHQNPHWKFENNNQTSDY